jgi:hypothetical protein
VIAAVAQAVRPVVEQHVHLFGDWIWIPCFATPFAVWARWRIAWALEALAVSQGARFRSPR